MKVLGEPESLDEILADFLDQVDNGAPVEREALLLRHPGFADQLASFFDDCDAVSRVIHGINDDDLLCESPELNADEWKQPETNAPSKESSKSSSKAFDEISLNELLSCLQHIDELLPENVDHENSQGSDPPLQLQQLLRQSDGSTSLGRFHLRRILGRGGFGIVFLADDPSLGRSVALKIPRPEIMFSRQAKQRFVREAQLAALLDHPAIVPVYETGEIGPLWYIASAYCNGPTLAAWLFQRAGPVSPRLAAHIVGRLACAVQHAHSRGVVHRDLKPSNILLEPVEKPPFPGFFFMPRVTDFGLGIRLEEDHELTRTGMLLGTSRYMAPEQARGDARSIGIATDIYALGVILYELLVGRPPFREDSIASTLQKVQFEEPIAPRKLVVSIPRDLDTICLHCLEKDPARRYGSVAQLGDDLGRFLGGLPVEARPLSLPELSARWVSRNRVASALFVVIVASLIAVSWLLVLAERRRELAEAKRREARATVDKLFTETSLFLTEYPHTADLQRRLLSLSRDAYEGFSREQSHDPDIQAEAARAAFRVAIIEQTLEHTDQSRAHGRDALERFQDLSCRFPDNEQFQFDIFHCQFFLQEYSEAFHIISDLCQRNPRPEYRDALAAAAVALGRRSLEGGEAAAAKSMFQLGLETAEKLSTEFPDVPSYRRHVGTNAIGLSRLRALGGDFTAALQLAEKAMQVGHELLQSSPLNSGYAGDYCGYCAVGVGAAYGLGEFDAVRQILNEWADVTAQLTTVHPNVPGAWHGLRSYQAVRMDFELESGNTDAAKQAAADHMATIEKLNARWPSPGGHLLLVRFLADSGIEELRDIDRASQLLRSAHLGDDPLCVGIVQLRTGDIEQAIQSLNSVDPSPSWQARLYLGLAYAMLGDELAANAALPSEDQWDPTSPEHGLLRTRIMKEIEQHRTKRVQPVQESR